MQRRQVAGAGLAQLVAEEFAEQRMVAVPAPLVVLGDEEELGLLRAGQQRRAVVALQHVIAERRAEFVEQAAADQEVAQFLRLARQHVFQQVVAERRIGAVEGLDEALCIGAALQRQGHQPERRDPAFGALLQALQLLVVQRQTAMPAEEVGGLGGAEAQVGGADLQQFAVGAEASEADVRQAPRADQQLAVGRQVIGDLPHQGEHRGIAQRLEVVEEEGEGLRQRHQLIGQVDGARDFVGADRKLRCDVLQGADQVADEARRVVVGVVQGQPGHRAAGRRQRLEGLAHDGRLAETGRRMHQDQPRGGAFADAREQVGALQRRAADGRRLQLGAAQAGAGGRGWRGAVRHCGAPVRREWIEPGILALCKRSKRWRRVEMFWQEHPRWGE
ncbi:hypothetical protein D9M71_413850 [compost metagenome]